MPPLQYLSTPESIPDKGVSGLKGDAIGNLNTNQQTLLAGERLGGSSTGSDYLAVKIENSYTNITTATTTVIKTNINENDDGNANGDINTNRNNNGNTYSITNTHTNTNTQVVLIQWTTIGRVSALIKQRIRNCSVTRQSHCCQQSAAPMPPNLI